MTRDPKEDGPPPPPDDPARKSAYQIVADIVQEELYATLRDRGETGADPMAILSGATAAIVRFCFAVMGEPTSARHAMQILIPACNFSCEQIARQLAEKEPQLPGLPPGRDRARMDS